MNKGILYYLDGYYEAVTELQTLPHHSFVLSSVSYVITNKERKMTISLTKLTYRTIRKLSLCFLSITMMKNEKSLSKRVMDEPNSLSLYISNN